MRNLRFYTILYRDQSLAPVSLPFAFTCEAENCEHAEEQLTNFEPTAKVVWIETGSNPERAYDSYYNGPF